MHPTELASLIRYHRKQDGLSQLELARQAGVGRNIVQELEAGRERASWGHLRAVLNVLHVRLIPTSPRIEQWREHHHPHDSGE